MKRILTAIAAAAALMTICWNADAGDYVYLELTKSEKEPLHFLAFSARGGSLTGHAFVVWYQLTTELGKSKVESWGLYPENEKKTVLGEVPGELRDEILEGSLVQVTDNLLVKIDSALYDKASQIRVEWRKKRRYRLIERDCVEFLAEIASAARLNTPLRNLNTLLPQAYVRELIQLNRPAKSSSSSSPPAPPSGSGITN